MKPTSILGRYLIKQIVINFIAVLLMVAGIIFMFEVIEQLRRTEDRPDIDAFFVLKMALFRLPRAFEIVFPFVMMISAMITFWKVSRSNEFVIIRAAGVSVWGFLLPVMSVVLVIGFINVMAVNSVSAYLYEAYETYSYRFKSKNPNAMLFSNKGLWIREAVNDNVFLVMEAKSVRQEDDVFLLRNVSILEMNRQSQLIKRVEAYAAELKDDKMELKDVKIFEAGRPTQSINNIDYKTTLSIDRIKENFIDPEAISFWNLPDTIAFYEKSGFSAIRHQMRYMSLWSSPFLLCAMVLVAAVFALKANSRRGGVMSFIVGGVSTGFIVYFLSQVIYTFGVNNYIPVLMATWSPTLIITMISISVLLHLEDD
jgi:lipopolysaccharide export system permease protein